MHVDTRLYVIHVCNLNELILCYEPTDLSVRLTDISLLLFSISLVSSFPPPCYSFSAVPCRCFFSSSDACLRNAAANCSLVGEGKETRAGR